MKQEEPEELREPLIFIGVGVRGSGKSYRMMLDLGKYLKTHKTRKIIVFDTNDEITFRKIKPIASWDIPKLKKNVGTIRRVMPFNLTTREALTLDEKAEMAFYLLSVVRDGMLVLEDINNYLIGTTQKAFISKLTTNRHSNLDLRLNLQGLAAITPRLWQNCNYIVMHYINENLARIKNKLPDYELYELARQIIATHYDAGDTRRFLYIDVQRNKILGISQNETSKDLPCTLRGVSYQELLMACASYLNLPPEHKKVVQLAEKKMYYILP